MALGRAAGARAKPKLRAGERAETRKTDVRMNRRAIPDDRDPAVGQRDLDNDERGVGGGEVEGHQGMGDDAALPLDVNGRGLTAAVVECVKRDGEPSAIAFLDET